MTAVGSPRPRRWPAGLAWAAWALTLLGLLATAWLDRRLRQAGSPDLASLSISSIPLVVAALSAATVGALLAAVARPTRWAGCCSAWGCAWSCMTSPSATPATGWW